MRFHKDYPKMPFVYHQEIFECFTEPHSLINSSLDRKHFDCAHCGKPLHGKRLKRHINICQKTAIHFFCSKECKNMWCFDTQKRR